MSKQIVFDTSIYIREMRKGNVEILQQRQSKYFPLCLSSIVLEEIYVGVSNKKSIRNINKLENDFSKVNRLLVPNQADWSIAGQILNKIGKKYGFDKVGKARLTNDAVLAMSCRANGFKITDCKRKGF